MSDGDPSVSRAHLESIARSMRRIVSLTWSPGFRDRFDSRAGVDLGITESHIVWELAHRRAASPGELAAIVDLGAPSISKALARLKERGLVELQVDDRDRRARTASLTDAGRAAAEALETAGIRMLEAIVSGWQVRDLVDFADGIGRYADGLERFSTALARDLDDLS